MASWLVRSSQSEWSWFEPQSHLSLFLIPYDVTPVSCLQPLSVPCENASSFHFACHLGTRNSCEANPDKTKVMNIQIEPPISDYPKCQAEMVTYGRWSLMSS